MFLESWNKIILDLDTRKSEHRDRNKDHRYYNRVIALSVREMWSGCWTIANLVSQWVQVIMQKFNDNSNTREFKYVGGDKIYFFRISCRTDIFAIDAGRFVIHESPQ